MSGHYILGYPTTETYPRGLRDSPVPWTHTSRDLDSIEGWVGWAWVGLSLVGLAGVAGWDGGWEDSDTESTLISYTAAVFSSPARSSTGSSNSRWASSCLGGNREAKSINKAVHMAIHTRLARIHTNFHAIFTPAEVHADLGRIITGQGVA